MAIRPMGPRIMVMEDEVVDEITARAKAAGLYAVIDERKKPKPTSGTVVAVGDDPLLQEQVKVGYKVTFAPHAGHYNFVAGQKLRVIEHHEIITVDDGT